MAKRNALGRGLGALIETDDNDGRIRRDAVNEIPLEIIEANPFQPRTEFDEEALAELADSIRELGIIQPITVSIKDDKFQLISGERRLRAAKIAGLKKIPAYVRTADDQGLLEMALVENIQRENLDAMEIAISYQRLMDECKLTQETLSERVGKKRSTVANYLRLLNLPPEVQLGIREKKISMGHARALINLKDEETRLMVYNQTLKYDFSVRKVEEFVRELNLEEKKNQTTAEKTKPVKKTAEEYESLQKHLSDYFHTDVKFARNTKGKGKIVIPFGNDEQLERIIAALDKLDK
ncbi:MAG: ParB/RepB/Spo0J family partition protein [Bacteroidales bacterium]|jgi:ParB family chromosome partitioning protein|nr:ParB/RepB/Spo0J family partition protein [Bacteroidales bacterium]